jgi:hypothetical protein
LMLMYAQGDIEIQIEFHSLLSEYQSFDKWFEMDWWLPSVLNGFSNSMELLGQCKVPFHRKHN